VTMSNFRIVLGTMVMSSFAFNSFACLPEDYVRARSPEKIRQRFDSVDTVLTARLISSEKVTIDSPVVAAGIPGESDTFVVTRVFKGRIRKGARFTLTTDLAGCGRSAVNDPPTVMRLGSEDPREYMKDWLLYMKSGVPAQIKKSELSMPLAEVSSDLPVLERLSRGGKGAPVPLNRGTR